MLVDRTGPEAEAARGRAARAAVPRRAHGEWAPAPDRPDPLDVLAAQARTRVPELVPLRHGRMLASPFAFFRGAAAIMAADLAATPVTGTRVQLCGDAHLGNFGAFAAPDRALVFDLNDFDETVPGPWEWDIKRLAASAAVAGRHLGLAEEERADAVRAAVREYRLAMRRFAAMRTLDVWYARLDVRERIARWEARMPPERRRRVERALDKGRLKDSVRAAAKLARPVDGELRFTGDAPLVVPLRDLLSDAERGRVERELGRILDRYRETLSEDRRHLLGAFRPVDVAHKVVGVGSVGMRAWIALFLGHDTDDPLVLQVKEAEPSVLEPFAGRSRFATHGRRVVEGQRLMQSASDVFLGWTRVEHGLDGRPHDYYVRQLWDQKVAPDLERMGAGELAAYAGLCGWTLARAHARSGDRFAIADYLGRSEKFDDALRRFAEAYADRNERDHAALAAAVRAGAVAADTGP